MEQKFRKKRLNSDLGLNLRSLEQKFRKKTRKFRPRSLQPKKDQVKNAWIQILERKHSGKKRLNILLWTKKFSHTCLARPSTNCVLFRAKCSYFGPNVLISGQMFLFRAKCSYFFISGQMFLFRANYPYFGPNVLISGQMSLFRAKCPYFGPNALISPSVLISGKMSLFRAKCPYLNVLISGQMPLFRQVSLFRAKCPYFGQNVLI